MLSTSLETKEILQHGATWMNLEGMVPSEVSQTPKDKSCMFHLSVESKIGKSIQAESGMGGLGTQGHLVTFSSVAAEVPVG